MTVTVATTPPPPPLHRIRGYLRSFPVSWTPYLGKKINPLSRVLVTIGSYIKRKYLSPGFLRKSSRDYAPKYSPFPRKWEHACGSHIELGGGGTILSRKVIYVALKGRLYVKIMTTVLLLFAVAHVWSRKSFTFFYSPPPPPEQSPFRNTGQKTSVENHLRLNL